MAVAIFHGEKGGVGKSTVAATYGEDLLQQGYSVTVVDGDTRNPDVGRYFQVYCPVVQIDVRKSSGWVELFNLLDEDENDEIVISLPAGLGRAWHENIQDLIGALKGTSRHGAIFWTLGRTADSIVLLRDILEVQKDLPIVAVRNLYHTAGDATRFQRWETSKTREMFLSNGGREITFPDLMDTLFDASFGATPPVRFLGASQRYGDRIRLEQWMKSASLAFETVAKSTGRGKR